MLRRKGVARSAKTWQKTRPLTAFAALLALGPLAFAAPQVSAAERVASLAGSREPAREVDLPQPLRPVDAARYQRIFQLQAAGNWAEADAEIARLKEQAQADVEAAKAQAIADIRGEVATLAIGAAEQVVGQSLDRDANVALVEQFIDSVGTRSN